jgi:hypothetical protein
MSISEGRWGVTGDLDVVRRKVVLLRIKMVFLMIQEALEVFLSIKTREISRRREEFFCLRRGLYFTK